MSLAATIVDELGGTNTVARETGVPPQTVSAWKTSKWGIPHWRRPALIELAGRLNKQLRPESAAYLASRDKSPTTTGDDSSLTLVSDVNQTCRAGDEKVGRAA